MATRAGESDWPAVGGEELSWRPGTGVGLGRRGRGDVDAHFRALEAYGDGDIDPVVTQIDSAWLARHVGEAAATNPRRTLAPLIAAGILVESLGEGRGRSPAQVADTGRRQGSGAAPTQDRDQRS